MPLNLKFLIPSLKSGQGLPTLTQEYNFVVDNEQDSAYQSMCCSQDSLANSTKISSAASTASQMDSAASNVHVRVPTINLTAEDGSKLTVPIRELPPSMIPLTKKFKDRVELERELKYHNQIQLAKNKDRTLGRMPDQRVVDTQFKKMRSDQMAGTSGLREDLQELVDDSGKEEMVNNYCDILIDQLQHVPNNKKAATFNGVRLIAKKYQELCNK